MEYPLEYCMAKNLYVGNLPFEVTEDELRTLFSQVGEVSSVNIITDRYTGQSRGFAFVEMTTQQAADEAIKRFNGSALGSRNLTVVEARPRGDRSREHAGFGRGRRDRH
jgi:RNA recognition motif-containing protein